MDLFDASLGVLTVAAHVPLADGAVRTRNGIGAADDTYHKVALTHCTVRPRIEHTTKGFVAENKPTLSGRSPAVLARSDLHVCAADPNRDRFHEY
jgi:hypothetical protein